MRKGICIGFCVALMVVAALSGCRQATSYNKTQYILDPNRAAEPVMASKDGVLEVRRFTIDSAFSGKNLLYRTGELEYEADFYHEFLVSPAAMIREATRNWLAQSNLFTRVVDAGGYAEPTYALEANITVFYSDTRDKDAPKAVIELRAFLLKVEGMRDPGILHGKTYTATQESETPAPEGLIAAFNACLQTILGDLEKDLAAKL
jgi:cholesterol transport system auxiliary component